MDSLTRKEIIDAIITNEKRMKKLRSLGTHNARIDKAIGLVNGECQTQKVKPDLAEKIKIVYEVVREAEH